MPVAPSTDEQVSSTRPYCEVEWADTLEGSAERGGGSAGGGGGLKEQSVKGGSGGPGGLAQSRSSNGARETLALRLVIGRGQRIGSCLPGGHMD